MARNADFAQPSVSSSTVAEPGHTFAFYSIATDHVGHREAAPVTPDAVTTLLLPGDMNFDSTVDTNDIPDFVLGLISADQYESNYGVPPSMHGDTDSDGDQDFDDIDGLIAILSSRFVLGLTDAADYELNGGVPSSVHNDTDGDGDQDFDNIDEFVTLLDGLPLGRSVSSFAKAGASMDSPGRDNVVLAGVARHATLDPFERHRRTGEDRFERAVAVALAEDDLAVGTRRIDFPTKIEGRPVNRRELSLRLRQARPAPEETPAAEEAAGVWSQDLDWLEPPNWDWL